MAPIVDGGDVWTKENPHKPKNGMDEYGDNSFMGLW